MSSTDGPRHADDTYRSTDPAPPVEERQAPAGQRRVPADGDNPPPQERQAPPSEAEKSDRPTKLRGPARRYAAKKAVLEFVRDMCLHQAAALTFFAVLSIFPALLALVSILGVVGQAGSTSQFMTDIVNDLAPENTANQINGVIDDLSSSTGAGLSLIIGVLVALWTASNYVNAFSRTMNRIYEVDEGRPFWKLRPIMYLITAVLVVIVAAAAVIVVVSGPVARSIGSVIGLGDQAVIVWNIAKWPVLLVLVMAVIAMLYYFTPNVKLPKFRWISAGAAIAIVVAAIASAGFGLYVALAGNYDATYGALAGVIIFLFWLWIMNMALLFGAEFDAELERARQLQGGIAAEEHLQLPLRDTRAIEKTAERRRKVVAQGRALRSSGGRATDAGAVDRRA